MKELNHKTSVASGRLGSNMPILIAGGGIGGLSLALMLHARGLSCQVFEAVKEVKPLGVGLNTLPHAIDELANLGLLPDLDAVALRTRELRYLNRFGQEVWREPRGVWAGHPQPQFSIHRGQLHQVLWKAVQERLGAQALLTDARLADFEQDEAGVTAWLTDGRRARGAALIGADGIHSILRSALHPTEGGVRWNGVQMWRGAVEWPAFLGGDTMLVCGDMCEKLVVYPIASGTQADTRLTNWVVCAQVADASQKPPKPQDWSRPGQLDQVMAHASRFDLPMLDVKAMVCATPQCWEYPMCDRDPLPFWTRGRVTLLGDAAHPMYPVGSNGASQAILDARCLADQLAQREAVEALWAYEAERLPKTSEIIRSNRLGGPERMLDLVAQRAPQGFQQLTDVIAWQELAEIAGGYAHMTGMGSPPRS